MTDTVRRDLIVLSSLISIALDLIATLIAIQLVSSQWPPFCAAPFRYLLLQLP